MSKNINRFFPAIYESLPDHFDYLKVGHTEKTMHFKLLYIA